MSEYAVLPLENHGIPLTEEEAISLYNEGVLSPISSFDQIEEVESWVNSNVIEEDKPKVQLRNKLASEMDYAQREATPGTSEFASKAQEELWPTSADFVESTNIPIASDAATAAKDVKMYMDDPESRTPTNFAITALSLLPGVSPAMAGAMVPFIFGTMAGKKAAKADIGMAEAYEMGEREGVDLEELRNLTGWYRSNMDGKLKFEVEDADAKFTTSFSKLPTTNRLEDPLKLGDVLDHPALYEQYPELKDVDFVKFSSIFGGRGEFLPESNIVKVSNQLNDKEALSTLMHEVQHWIQYQEDFAFGGSPGLLKISDPGVADILKKEIQDRVDSPAYPSKDYAKKQLDVLNNDIAKIKIAEDRVDLLTLSHEVNKASIDAVENAIYKKAKRLADFDEFRNITKAEKFRDLGDKLPSGGLKGREDKAWDDRRVAHSAYLKNLYGNKTVMEFRDALKKKHGADLEKLNNAYKDSRDSLRKARQDLDDISEGLDFEAYRLLAGEKEARDVQHRLKYTPEERANIPPFSEEGKDNFITTFAEKPEAKRLDPGLYQDEAGGYFKVTEAGEIVEMK